MNNDWEQRVVGWCEARNLVKGSTAQHQLGKLLEEISELAVGIANNDKDKIADSVGDCSVVLCLIAEISGVGFGNSLECAWGEIKDRRGRMVDGIFVKEE